jgi:predicted transposase YbfD/YdcC
MRPVELPDKYIRKLSKECVDLLYRLLQTNSDIRIEWTELFRHPWILSNLTLQHENALIENPLAFDLLEQQMIIPKDINSSDNGSIINHQPKPIQLISGLVYNYSSGALNGLIQIPPSATPPISHKPTTSTKPGMGQYPTAGISTRRIPVFFNSSIDNSYPSVAVLQPSEFNHQLPTTHTPPTSHTQPTSNTPPTPPTSNTQPTSNTPNTPPTSYTQHTQHSQPTSYTQHTQTIQHTQQMPHLQSIHSGQPKHSIQHIKRQQLISTKNHTPLDISIQEDFDNIMEEYNIIPTGIDSFESDSSFAIATTHSQSESIAVNSNTRASPIPIIRHPKHKSDSYDSDFIMMQKELKFVTPPDHICNDSNTNSASGFSKFWTSSFRILKDSLRDSYDYLSNNPKSL